MNIILSICLLLICTCTNAQEQLWKSHEYNYIPDGLKEKDALLVFVTFSKKEIEDLGLHEDFTTNIYNKCILAYAEKYYTGPKKIMSMSEFTANKDDYDYAFLPVIYESGRKAGTVTRSFGVVDLKNEIVYSRYEVFLINLGAMKDEIKLEIRFIEHRRNN